MTLKYSSGEESKRFEICTAALPRFFHTQFESGVENIQVTFDGWMEKDVGNNCHYVEATRARWISWFGNGIAVSIACISALCALTNTILGHRLRQTLSYILGRKAGLVRFCHNGPSAISPSGTFGAAVRSGFTEPEDIASYDQNCKQAAESTTATAATGSDHLARGFTRGAYTPLGCHRIRTKLPRGKLKPQSLNPDTTRS